MIQAGEEFAGWFKNGLQLQLKTQLLLGRDLPPRAGDSGIGEVDVVAHLLFAEALAVGSDGDLQSGKLPSGRADLCLVEPFAWMRIRMVPVAEIVIPCASAVASIMGASYSCTQPISPEGVRHWMVAG